MAAAAAGVIRTLPTNAPGLPSFRPSFPRSRSLVNENSDTWVVKQLGDELMPKFRSLRKEEQLGWTQIMNRQMRSLWEKGVSIE